VKGSNNKTSAFIHHAFLVNMSSVCGCCKADDCACRFVYIGQSDDKEKDPDQVWFCACGSGKCCWCCACFLGVVDRKTAVYSPSQLDAMRKMCEGKDVLISGEAGSGKSMLIHDFISLCLDRAYMFLPFIVRLPLEPEEQEEAEDPDPQEVMGGGIGYYIAACVFQYVHAPTSAIVIMAEERPDVKLEIEKFLAAAPQEFPNVVNFQFVAVAPSASVPCNFPSSFPVSFDRVTIKR
jgi:hypothetical protein